MLRSVNNPLKSRFQWKEFSVSPDSKNQMLLQKFFYETMLLHITFKNLLNILDERLSYR